MDIDDFLKCNDLNVSKDTIKNIHKNKIGILITNLGSPSKPTYWSLYKYLSRKKKKKKFPKWKKKKKKKNIATRWKTNEHSDYSTDKSRLIGTHELLSSIDFCGFPFCTAVFCPSGAVIKTKERKKEAIHKKDQRKKIVIVRHHVANAHQQKSVNTNPRQCALKGLIKNA
ncbi:ferrochelatase, putative (FC) [Plasmodium ovale wallikeri]|uniref:Ferrochelatase, putative (FC) n=1 Tax=Plasmodium ovale wallikeri TaxID=864142 RepID=A0A1A8Z1B4_PLAOA|nr:ferrochelatase, putative (FC) [Plasmodium ovale wallikeri]